MDRRREMYIFIVYTVYFLFVMRHGTFPELLHYFIYALGVALLWGRFEVIRTATEGNKEKRNTRGQRLVNIFLTLFASLAIFFFREQLIEIDNSIYLSVKAKSGVLMALLVDFIIPILISFVPTVIASLFGRIAKCGEKKRKRRKLKVAERHLGELSAEVEKRLTDAFSFDFVGEREIFVDSVLKYVDSGQEDKCFEFGFLERDSDEIRGTNERLSDFLQYVKERVHTEAELRRADIIYGYSDKVNENVIEILNKWNSLVWDFGQNKVSDFIKREVEKIERSRVAFQRYKEGYEADVEAFEKDYASIMSGVAGERIVYDALKLFDYEMCILKNVTLRFGDKSAENDFIIVAPQGVFSIEVKNRWKKENLILHIGRDGSWAEEYSDGSRHPIENDPSGQTNWHLAVLGQIISENFGKRNINVSGIVSIANNKAKIINDSLQKIVRPAEIINVIHAEATQLNEIEIREIVRVLKLYEDEPKKFGIKNYDKFLSRYIYNLDKTVSQMYWQSEAILDFLNKWEL